MIAQQRASNFGIAEAKVVQFSAVNEGNEAIDMKTFDKEQCELTEPEARAYTIKCWEGEGQFYMEAERAFRLEVQNNTFTNPIASLPGQHLLTTVITSVTPMTPGVSSGSTNTWQQVALIRVSQVMLGMSRSISARIQMIGSGICQAMDSAIIQITDYLDAQELKLMNRINRVDPWIQEQATQRLDKLKTIIAHGGNCPYSDIFVPPPESTGVR